ncbi:unnamed protein product [Lymnaea stagnalis]|uniref:Uncharacterized protein n=1 Tax=Lymnaea stagnalis TaxID=6523 RepID=A0AAV2HT47_LYMST
MSGPGANPMSFDHPKPYQGTIGKGNMKYDIDFGQSTAQKYKGSIDPKDAKPKTKDFYKQTIETKPKRAPNRPAPPKAQPKPPKPAPIRQPTKTNMNPQKFKGYESKIKWQPGQKEVLEYKPKPYNGTIKTDPSSVQQYELPEDYYGFPKGKKQEPVKVKTPEKKVKRNKVEPVPPPYQSPVPPVKSPVKPQPPPPPPPVVHDPLFEPIVAPQPRKESPLTVVAPPPPPRVLFDPPTPEPPMPTRRSVPQKPEPFYNTRPEPIFPPLIPVTLEDYVYNEPRHYQDYHGKKERGNPLIPVMYPVRAPKYDDAPLRYSPPPPLWTVKDEIYPIKGSGVPLYSAVGSILRSSDYYQYY